MGTMYSDVPDADASALLDRFFETGLTHIDTAPYYGYGKSEERIGRKLQGRPRDSFVIATKIGRVLAPEETDKVDRSQFVNPNLYRPVFDYSYDGVMRSFESSLERLNVETIDILHIHDPDDHWPQAIGEAYPAMRKLKDQKLIRAIGAGMNQWQMLSRFAREGEFDCFLLAGRYTLIDHSALDELLPLCQQKQISIIVGGPFNSGILASSSPEAGKFNYENAPAAIVEKVRKLDMVCARHGVSRKAAALQFPLAHPAVACVVAGARKREEFDENCALFEQPIPAEFWADLKATGVIPAEAPTPGAAASHMP